MDIINVTIEPTLADLAHREKVKNAEKQMAKKLRECAEIASGIGYDGLSDWFNIRASELEEPMRLPIFEALTR